MASPEVQLDFIPTRNGTNFIRRTRSEVLRSQARAEVRREQEKEREHKIGTNVPGSSIVEARRIVRIEEDRKLLSIVVTQKDRHTGEVSMWRFVRNIPEEDIPREADIRMMWMAAGSMDFTNLGFGPAIDTTLTFGEDLHIEAGEGYTIKHGGVVFEDQAEPRKIVGFDKGFKTVSGGQVGVYRRLSPERAQALGLTKETLSVSLAS